MQATHFIQAIHPVIKRNTLHHQVAISLCIVVKGWKPGGELVFMRTRQQESVGPGFTV